MDLKDLKLTAKRQEICKRLGFNSSYDVLSYYPYKYDNYEIVRYKDFKIGETIMFEAELITSPSTFRYGKRSTTRFKVLYDDEQLLVTIFNRPWIRNLDINDKVVIIGKYDGNNKVTALNYYTKDVNELVGIVPTYSTSEGISQNEIKKLISLVYENCSEELVEHLPSEYIKAHNLIDYKTAIFNIHNPINSDLLRKSLARLKYEEFLNFYVALNILKGNTTNSIKNKKVFDQDKIDAFIDSLGFKLTTDQETCIKESLNDLASDKIMYRLIQGEVGSGKTVISEVMLYANYLAGYQGCLMAPTEILAKQHYESFVRDFACLGIKIGVLYSAMDNEKEVKRQIENGELDIIIGTHALFSNDVSYSNLGLVIADEQHRFGVKQRNALKNKGDNTDFCLMSATPIPRTLASSLYGDMDISTIETLPSGRKGCKTYLIKKNSIVDILDVVKDTLKQGRQIYIIAAAIEKSENYNAKDVTGLYNSLLNELSPYKVSLLHGKLSSQEKDLIMKDFNDNKIQVLISTTVVEVGVNVKNATMMIVYDADKFGLSQLHQLRGRIQRGNYEGVCFLLTNSKDESVIKRLEVLCNCNDGFKISLEDLKLRGPGDILGTRQSGLPTFILGNIFEDGKFIEAAKKDAKQICDNLDDEEANKYYNYMMENIKDKVIS
ncbi:MAG: ATP-dependent DNA helicase RecG [Erysipelotrichaceae bacterium]|nr:ATP-dependent DNA helicase RecG [Erysipelotrichaceae bacterium]